MKNQTKTAMKKRLLVQAMKDNLGIVSKATAIVGISRNQFYHYYNTDAVFRAEIDEIDEITLDFAESQLLKKIEEGSERSILFYMKYKGKKRGYTDSLDITTNGENVNNVSVIKLIEVKKDDDETK